MNNSEAIESVQYAPENLRRVQELLDRDGFVKIESVFSTNEVHELQREMRQIVDQLDPESQPKSVFTTKDEQKVTLKLLPSASIGRCLACFGSVLSGQRR